MYKIEIELSPEEIRGLEGTVQDVQETQNCTEAEAVKHLLGTGLNAYRSQRYLEKRREEREERR